MKTGFSLMQPFYSVDDYKNSYASSNNRIVQYLDTNKIIKSPYVMNVHNYHV